MNQTVLQHVLSIAGVPDTQTPGLTKFIPQANRPVIPLNPLGVYTPPVNTDNGELFPQEFLVGTNPMKVRFPAHEHIMFQNQGLVTIQISKDAARWFDFLTSGLILVLDYHKEDALWLQTAAGSCVVVITTW